MYIYDNLAIQAFSHRTPLFLHLKVVDLYHFKITDDLDSDREPRTHLGRFRTDKGPKSEIMGSHDCDLCESARRSSPGRRALYNGVQTAHFE